MSLPLTDANGNINVAVDGVPVSWNGGIGYAANGAMCVTATLGANDQYQDGTRLSPTGLVVVAAQSGSLFYNAGLPFNAADGSMARQTDIAPAAGDSFVSGVRVSPTGGVCFTTAAPT